MININIEIFRHNIVEYALTFLNKKYTWGSYGNLEFDEAGFTWYIYKILFDIDINENGYGLDDTTKQMTSSVGNLTIYIENDSNKNKYINNINIGDLVFFHKKSLDDNVALANNRYPGDVGIYIGNNKFIHASNTCNKITIDQLDDYWLKILVASKDIVDSILKRDN